MGRDARDKRQRVGEAVRGLEGVSPDSRYDREANPHITMNVQERVVCGRLRRAAMRALEPVRLESEFSTLMSDVETRAADLTRRIVQGGEIGMAPVDQRTHCHRIHGHIWELDEDASRGSETCPVVRLEHDAAVYFNGEETGSIRRG